MLIYCWLLVSANNKYYYGYNGIIMSSSSQATASASSQTREPSSQQSKNSSSTQKQNKKSSDSTLAPLLRHFVGIDLIVETKQGRTFRGTLREADTYMNLVLSRNISQQSNNNNVTKSKLLPSEQSLTDGALASEQLQLRFDLVHIRGPTIRYIVFGPSVDITGVIKAGRDRERAAGDKYRRGVRKAPRR